MAIPDYQTVMLPLLKLTSDGKEHQIREAVNTLADQFKLAEAERKETLPSGGGIFDNRVGWAPDASSSSGVSLDSSCASTGISSSSSLFGYLKLRKQLESDLLARVKACSPDFFERLVVRLLTAMGYGGSLADAGKAMR